MFGGLSEFLLILFLEVVWCYFDGLLDGVVVVVVFFGGGDLVGLFVVFIEVVL